jgi:Protein of unknown function (DUF1236)
MTSRFMMSVATAALIAGTSFAYAQEKGHEAGPAAQQSAPAAEHGATTAPAGRDAAKPMAPSSGMKATQSEQKPPASNQRAEENMQGQKPNGMRSENNNATGGKDMKAEGRSENKDMKAEGRENTDMKGEGRDNKMNADSKGTAERSQTTGQAGAGAKLSGEQRTKITTVIRNEHVRPLEHVNFSISVGTRVPRDVEFHRLPTEVITYYPEWRDYEYILVNGQILVIDPATYEIVAVLDA